MSLLGYYSRKKTRKSRVTLGFLCNLEITLLFGQDQNTLWGYVKNRYISGKRMRQSKQEVIMIKTDIKVFKTSHQPSHPHATFPFMRPIFPSLNSKIINLSQEPQLESFGTVYLYCIHNQHWVNNSRVTRLRMRAQTSRFQKVLYIRQHIPFSSTREKNGRKATACST